MLQGKGEEIATERMKRLGQSRNNTQLRMSAGESKVQCSKEQYCIGNWNVRSMSQSKLEEMIARVNVNILGISELKWLGTGKFNTDDHYTYYGGQESLRRNRNSPHGQQKS